jgi:hypothetical protein
MFAALLSSACAADPSAAASTSTSSSSDAVDSSSSSESTSGIDPSTTTEHATNGTSTDGGESTEASEGPLPVMFDVGTAALDVPDAPPPLCPCAANTDRIHVVTTTGELWAFDPPTLEFELVVDLLALPGCAGPQFFSMSLDRDGLAWLQFNDGTLHTLDINAPVACSDADFVSAPELAITNFGMGFVSESVYDSCDSLFGHRISGFGDGPGVGLLFEVDTTALDVAASYPTDFDRAELTGTGDGRLFAFADSIPAKLVELDKDSGATLDQIDLNNINASTAFAFAAYGGDFYFFTGSDSNIDRSEVNHIDYDDSDGNGLQDVRRSSRRCRSTGRSAVRECRRARRVSLRRRDHAARASASSAAPSNAVGSIPSACIAARSSSPSARAGRPAPRCAATRSATLTACPICE